MDADSAITDTTPVGRWSRLGVGLVVAIVLLLGVAGVEGWLLLRDDEPAGEASGPAAPPSAERPVQLSELTVRSVVDQAATAAETILSASAEGYDAEVAEATALMTDDFATRFARTKGDVEEEFVAADTTVAVDVSAQGVVSATADELVALLFLTQTTVRGEEPARAVQYRVEVTMVDTPDGWLVSGLRTR